MSSIYDEDLSFDLEAWRNEYIMSPQLWSMFAIDDLPNVDFTKWHSMKLMNDTGDSFSQEIRNVPTCYGGIYVYSICPGIIPDCGSYVMYIGKATKTPNENLRNRVRAYQNEIGRNYTRDRLHRLFSKWGKYTYLYYLPVDSDADTILELETRLIAAFVPPCNADIRAKGVKRAVRAFH